MVVGEIIQERQLVIIGGGPGGYNAAIRAVQLGLEVTLIEKGSLGGVCLSHGCIPSKFHAKAASILAEMESLSSFGISANLEGFQISELLKNQAGIIAGLQKGVEALCKANKIEVINAEASILPGNRIGIDHGDSYEMFRYEKLIISTGAKPKIPKGVNTDSERILSSHEIYHLDVVPEHLLIYGADYIALEAASTFRAYGADVTLILDEGKTDFPFDKTINKELHRIMKKSKIKVIKGQELIAVTEVNSGVQVSCKNDTDEVITVEGSHLLVSCGAEPNSRALGLEGIGVDITGDGFIIVNECSETSLEGVYAVGDVSIGPSLAVKAIKQGKIAAEHCAGKSVELNLNTIPTIIHGHTPIATVGLTEEEAVSDGYEVVIGDFPLAGNGFASLSGNKNGLVKIVMEKETELILGIHMIGAGAVELIGQGILALEMVARAEDLATIYYPHPSLNEGWLEAVESLTGKAIHIPPAKQKELLSKV